MSRAPLVDVPVLDVPVLDVPVLELRGVGRRHGSPPVDALIDVDLRIDSGEMVAIVGPSGSGKTTLLSIMGTLDAPSSGEVLIDGRVTAGLHDNALATLRAEAIGFVFQQFHLLDGSTAEENVADGLLYRAVPHAQRLLRAREALGRVGLAQRSRHRPQQLSGGERQRVAIARALVGRPRLVLADEPTGNLDSTSGAGIVALLRELNESGTTLVVITHDRDLAATFPRQVHIQDGRIVHDSAVAAPAGAR